MANDRLTLVKLRSDAVGELFAIILMSGSVWRRNHRMNRSPRALTEHEVRDALAQAGISTDDVASLLQRARDDFRIAVAVPYTVH